MPANKRLIESQARDSTTKIVQASETEMKERRIELNKETGRLDKRRSEVRSRRQADSASRISIAVSRKLTNGTTILKKLYEDQVTKLEQIAYCRPTRRRKNCSPPLKKKRGRHGADHPPDRSGSA
ncbi:MAG: hypothetical protein U0X93_11720 [Anaerolineales bacterium]